MPEHERSLSDVAGRIALMGIAAGARGKLVIAERAQRLAC
jgi:hypothetical protein